MALSLGSRGTQIIRLDVRVERSIDALGDCRDLALALGQQASQLLAAGRARSAALGREAPSLRVTAFSRSLEDDCEQAVDRLRSQERELARGTLAAP
jgi:hypothetical protein